MVRTQIYLTEYQRDQLATMAKSAKKKQSELIREAIDKFINQSGNNYKELVLRETAGIWKNRTDLPDFETLRAEWDRV